VAFPLSQSAGMEPTPAATLVVARPAAEGIEVLALRRSGGTRFLPGFVVFPGGVIEPGDETLARDLLGDPAESPRACALRELAEEAGLRLTVDGLERSRVPAPVPVGLLPEIARWIAPEFLETRFDARFFAATAPRGVEPVPDRAEIDAAWWARPEDLMDAELMWPTVVTLRALAGCRSPDDVLSLRVEQVPNPRAPR
jgi:8-oxo-dGTP pyrophosphatase MutT (NUDIX family)